MQDELRSRELTNFIDSFGLPRDGFGSPVPYSDAFGFSTSKDRAQDGYGFTSIYGFYVRNEDMRSDSTIKPVWVSVSYGEKQEDGSVRLSPTSVERQLNWPIDFISNNDFYFDTTSKTFLRHGRIISGADILKMAESLHMRPTRKFAGLFLRFRLWSRSILAGIFQGFYKALNYVLYTLSGTWTTQTMWEVYVAEPTKAHSNLPEPEIDSFAAQTIDVFGYKASAWAVVAYSLIHLAAYIIWFFASATPIEFIRLLFSNSFLTVTYAIPTIVLYERGVPELLKWYIRYVVHMHYHFTFRRINLDF